MFPRAVSGSWGSLPPVLVAPSEWPDEYQDESTSPPGRWATVPSGVPCKSHRCTRYIVGRGLSREVM